MPPGCHECARSFSSKLGSRLNNVPPPFGSQRPLQSVDGGVLRRGIASTGFCGGPLPAPLVEPWRLAALGGHLASLAGSSQQYNLGNKNRLLRPGSEIVF